MSGASIAFAALLLIIPGFFTDLIGFFLLIPFLRNNFFKLILKNEKIKNKENQNTIDGEIVKRIKMSYKIIGKYIKNLNFSIPNTKTFYLLSKDISKYKINIDIKSNRVKQNIIEIFTSLNLKPTENEFEAINTEIIFATIIELTDDKIDKKKLEKIILVHVPSNIYSELRSIFVRLFENSGFKDVKISESVDFEKLYNLKKIQ